MAKKWCRDGEHEVKVAFQPRPGEMFCGDPDCVGYGVGLVEQPKEGGAGLSRGGFKRATAAYERTRSAFNNSVCRDRCFFADDDEEGNPRRPGHVCSNPLDGHHVVEKQWIKRNFSDLDEDELLAILFNPFIGAPLCRNAHEAIKTDRIYWDEVRFECIEFCEEVDRTYPTIASTGGKRPSMLERLKLECPERDPSQVAA